LLLAVAVAVVAFPAFQVEQVAQAVCSQELHQ
jgi:hypothetical protein